MEEEQNIEKEIVELVPVVEDPKVNWGVHSNYIHVGHTGNVISLYFGQWSKVPFHEMGRNPDTGRRRFKVPIFSKIVCNIDMIPVMISLLNKFYDEYKSRPKEPPAREDSEE
ncbi:MAG: hypothetical protein J7M18_03740 [Candidatus Eremiobacteraeota bacterium]|nr:hypothetical protein [Candidatus Eremiobacteraeota bacterium]